MAIGRRYWIPAFAGMTAWKGGGGGVFGAARAWDASGVCPQIGVFVAVPYSLIHCL
ncbi:MAG: hypothetical protein IPP85_01960 [Propionivibrio sp.]|nr:hypothetical protein [Propionivibrio sp.]